MATYGKANATGRSTGKLTSKDKKVFNPPGGRDNPWAWLTVELMQSPAWRAMTISARLLIDRLLIEHRSHSGFENGRLKVTHRQFAEHGVGKSAISATIEECESLGLLRADRGGRHHGSNMPSTYRLTFYATHDRNPATNEWRAITPAMIERLGLEKRRNTTSLANLKRGARAPIDRGAGGKNSFGAPNDRGTVARNIGAPTKPTLVKS